MATWRTFISDNVQTAVFLPEKSPFFTGKAVASILTRFGDRFTGDMQTLPAMTDLVPPEVPRVTLRSEDDSWQLNMGPARIDCVWSNKPLTPVGLVEKVAACAEVVLHYAQVNNATVGRLAVIVRRFCRSDNPAQELITQFCSEPRQRGPLNRSATFEIHNHKTYTPTGFSYRLNSWVRCKSGILLTDKSPVITVEQDLNTLAQELATRKFTVAEMRGFFEATARETDDILRKYFPD